MNDDFNSKLDSILILVQSQRTQNSLGATVSQVRGEAKQAIISLIKSEEEKVRESERDHIFSVIRSLGYKIDRSAVIKLHREWDANAKEVEARRAILDGGRS